jgi:hypothetical protein
MATPSAAPTQPALLVPDGVYLTRCANPPVLRHVGTPSTNDLQALVEQIAARVGERLERCGLIERDLENAWLASDGEAGPLDDLIGPSITYRIAVGPRAGQKLFTVQAVPARRSEEEGSPNGAARAGGFSLHAGIDMEPAQREKLERLCRYVTRPPVAEDRLALTPSGHVRYQLKTPYRDGTTQIVLEPLDFIARLAAPAAPAAARGDGLGAAAEAGLRHRDRELRARRREAADHDEHRAARGDRDGPLASGEDGRGAGAARAVTGRSRAARARAVAQNLKCGEFPAPG